MRYFLFISALLISFIGLGQSFTIDPAFPSADQPITLTVDITGVSSLEDETELWLWAFLPDCSSNCDATTNINPATSETDAVKFSPTGNSNEYTLTFTPTAIFEKTASEITRIGFVVKARAFTDGQTQDLFFDIASGELEVSFTIPSAEYIFVDGGASLSIMAQASMSAELSLEIDGTEVVTNNGTSISYLHTITESGTVEVAVTASSGGSTVTDQFYFIVRAATVAEALPAGVIKGINYNQGDATHATLALEAPGKNTIYVTGEFNNWLPTSNYQMKKDADIFWLEINGLVPGQEYAFQYLVDEEIVVADPYTDKVLDPDNDPFIPEATYSSLKPYPEGAEGIVSVLQTNQTPYAWQTTDFIAPAAEELVIYELLVRDFDEKQNYDGIIDHLNYLEELGVNAIQLMPIMEFDGNLSWGYNPSFFFAADKYYGSKDALKAFIDECHSRGIAVILDMVLNHTHEDNPIAQLYWDEANFRPATDNPWLNQQARHPFNVFYDFNHESAYTQDFVDTVNYYWLEEYKFDGYRFDLTKGFTQDFTASSDVGAWSNYNQTRIDLLLRMTEAIRQHHPDAYIIFEHLADNSEEKVLADNGIMLWGNMNHNFNQLTMGYSDDSGVDWAYYGTREWNDPNLIAYMESHDEERLVYRNQEFGNTSNGGHNTKNLDVALERVKGASAIYYGIPGPKMIWQFGELGYDKPINLCPDGTVNNDCRVAEKPIPWATADDGLDYNTDPERLDLYQVTGELIKLKTTYDVFNSTDFSLDESQSLVKQIIIKNDPYTDTPSSTSEMNVVIAANFNVSNRDVTIQFPHSGEWYEYFAADEITTISGSSQMINMGPGEFRIYTDVELPATAPELTWYAPPIAPTNLAAVEVPQEGIRLTWNDNSSIETAYTVWRLEDGGAFEQIESAGVDAQQFLDVTAEANKNYTYRVEAKNKHYASASNDVEITTTNVITSLAGEEEGLIRVAPNPSDGIIKLLNLRGSYQVEVLTLSGQRVYQNQLLESEPTIDLKSLTPGIYILHLANANQSINQRIIITE